MALILTSTFEITFHYTVQIYGDKRVQKFLGTTKPSNPIFVVGTYSFHHLVVQHPICFSIYSNTLPPPSPPQKKRQQKLIKTNANSIFIISC